MYCFKATGGLFWDEPHISEPRSDDWGNISVDNLLSKLPHHNTGEFGVILSLVSYADPTVSTASTGNPPPSVPAFKTDALADYPRLSPTHSLPFPLCGSSS
ncbi:hypothetical protein AVEN_86025-1 [Araneus ventricosus]|uniref:Uncharacterized protein n=1 Tax=Araneus ventricosus TaxID=182803 RepID=A0A4Y2U4A1_ARAVE|nr:hypothetical protein AVEN_86025-1 [Araneus ventricosus]